MNFLLKLLAKICVCDDDDDNNSYEDFNESIETKKEQFTNLINQIGVPSMSQNLYCKESELHIIHKQNSKNLDICNVVLNNLDMISYYSSQCIGFCNHLVENKNVKTLTSNSFESFIHNGRFWYTLQTHFTFCENDQNKLKIIKDTLEVWILTLINVYHLYFYDPNIKILSNMKREIFKTTKQSILNNTQQQQQQISTEKSYVSFPPVLTKEFNNNKSGGSQQVIKF